MLANNVALQLSSGSHQIHVVVSQVTCNPKHSPEVVYPWLGSSTLGLVVIWSHLIFDRFY
jgi:hypothetical protein